MYKLVAICSVLAISLGGNFVTAAPYVEDQVFADIASKGSATVILHFKGSKTREVLKSFYAEHKPNEKAVHHDVLPNMLEANANKHQAQTLEFLKGRMLSKASGSNHVQLWMLNQLVVHETDRDLLKEFQKSHEITYVEANREYQLLESVMERDATTDGPHILDGTTDGPHILLAEETKQESENQWGVEDVGAPEVWAKGFYGQNVTVGIIDTGVRVSHEILKSNYRTGGYGWYDATNPLPILRSQKPYDDNGHGTHCAGTIAGTKGYGVAPQANWIACKALNILGSGNNAGLRTCGQFMLCPTDYNGRNRDCSQKPSVISNSWGSTSSTPFYNDIIDAWVANGQIAVFANGNAGDKCDSTGSPGDYVDAIGVGATNRTNQVAKFSSRGPAASGIMKPDISAPGQDIKSAGYLSNTAYRSLSGTSMAAPHIAGVAALYLSNDPTLNQTQVLQYFRQGAKQPKSINQECGGTKDSAYPNNVVGWGKVYAPAAYE